jgi:hypothetical protein
MRGCENNPNPNEAKPVSPFLANGSRWASLRRHAYRLLPNQIRVSGEAVDSLWTTKWKGKRLPSGEFCLESPTLQTLFNQGIPDNLFE